MEHWVWPLPPAGPFALVCEWPSRGIGETRVEIDAGVILESVGCRGFHQLSENHHHAAGHMG
jgi:hypothetical protein